MDQKLGQVNMAVEERWLLMEVRLYFFCELTLIQSVDTRTA